MSSTTTLYLARHGQTDFNKASKVQGRGIDAPLNELGLQQSQKIKEFFETKQIQADYLATSSLKRAQQTIEPLEVYFGLKADRFKEVDEMDFGDWEGESFYDLDGSLFALHEEWGKGEVTKTTPNGESPVDVFNRASGKIEEIAKAHLGKTVVLVLHGRLLRILFAGWLSKDLTKMASYSHKNACINHLEYDSAGNVFKAIELNQTSHLAEFESES